MPLPLVSSLRSLEELRTFDGLRSQAHRVMSGVTYDTTSQVIAFETDSWLRSSVERVISSGVLQ